MKKIITEVCIPLGEFKTIYSAQRVYIRVYDKAAGPYLAIEGVNDEAEVEQGEKAGEFYLDGDAEIDEFARICKEVLASARESAIMPKKKKEN